MGPLPLILTLVGCAILAAVLYIRFAPLSPDVWHKDPTLLTPSGKPNWAKHTGAAAWSSALDAPAAMERLREIIEAEPRMEQLAQSGPLMRTYVQRSLVMGYPDVINVKVEPYEGGSRLSLFSVSRFGYSDWGVNRARLDALRAAFDGS